MRVVLILLLVGLGALLYVQWEIAPVQAPGRMPSRTMAQPGGQEVKSTKVDFAITLDPPDAFDVISQRPLFVEGRRPPDTTLPVVPEPEVNDSALQGLDLSAVLITPNSSVAWVKDQTAGELVRLEPGRKIRGWTVRAVMPDMLWLAAGEQTAEIQLREFPAQAASVAQKTPKPAKRPRPQKRTPRRTPVQNRNQQQKN